MIPTVSLVLDDAHAAALEALDREVFPHPSLSVRDELGRSFALLFAATFGDEIVGYLLAWQVADELEIHDVATAPRARRAGIGRALVQAALAEAKARGVSTAHLEVSRGNEAARALYARVGFTEDGVRRGYYQDGQDALLLRVAIDTP